MKTLDTIAGKLYAVMSPNGGTVTSADGLVSEEVEAGKQVFIVGTGAPLQLDDEAGRIIATFNLAPAKLRLLGLLGGGVSATLPSGYLAAEFVESTAKQYFGTGFYPTSYSKIEFTYRIITSNTGSAWLFANADARHTETGKCFKFARSDSMYMEFGDVYHRPTIPKEGKETISFEKDRVTLNGSFITDFSSAAHFIGTTELTVPRNTRDSANPNDVEFYACKLWEAGELVRDYVPCISPEGQVVMYDKVQGKNYPATSGGEFAVGMTLAQARKLGKLPAGGGTLTISLPSNWQEDAGVVDALAAAESKGWVFTYRTYEAEAGTVSTFALRRIWVRKTQDDGGSYVAADGSRWLVEWCAGMIGADPQEHGYEPFRSVDAAVSYWELEHYVNPEEELLTEE